MNSELIQKSQAYARQALANLPPEITYHTFVHTAEVAEAAERIGKACGLSDRDLETTIIAAWFHDTGYQKGHYQHEGVSAAAAEENLRKWGLDEARITEVKNAIEATRMPQVPRTMIDKVLCDADMFHLATENAEKHAELLRKEIATTRNFIFTDEEWVKNNYNFLRGHDYHTPYGQTVLNEQKKKIVKRLKKKVKPKAPDDGYVKELEEELDKYRKKLGKKANPERGIETMFRIASENHTTLSGMADTKANIMISINSIILSVVVSVLFRKLEEFPNLLIPTMMLVTVCLLTIIYAVRATRPNVSSGKFTRQDIEKKKTNLLFFGNFYRMDLPEFEWGMKEMMKDADFLYGSLMKDIYFNGKVLARKYMLLRIAYNIFMFGFVASIVAFTIALMWYYPASKLPL